MLCLLTAFPKLRLCTAALLAVPLLIGSAAAAPPTDTHPLTKRQPVAAARPKASAGARQTITPAPLAAAPLAVAPALPAAPPTAAPVAPQTVRVKGIVLAPDGQPCAGASVYLAGAPRQLVVTDAQGAFSLPVPAGEPVSLRIDYFGEGSSRVEVPTPGSEPLRITLGK